MAATMATSAKCMSLNPPSKSLNPSKPISSKSLVSLPNPSKPTISVSLAAAAVFSALSTANPAFAVQQIADLSAEGSDNRGLALLLPIIPAIGWVLFNILQPALNQLNRMRNSKGIAVGIGLGGGLAASELLLTPPPEAYAAVDEIAASGGDNRGQLLLFVVAPALLWVAYNILQPALNQLNRMRSE